MVKEQDTNFIFVNAPTILNAGPRDARRELRSQLMRRVYMKNHNVATPSRQGSVEAPTQQQQAPKTERVPGCQCRSSQRHRPSTAQRVQKRVQRKGRSRSGSDDSSSESDDQVCEKCTLQSLGRKVKAEVASGAIQTLAASKVDPFNGLENSADTPNCQELIYHFTDFLIPALGQANNWTDNAKQEYLQNVTQPWLLHTMCFCASVDLEHRERVAGITGHKDRAIQSTFYRYTALREVRRELEKRPQFGSIRAEFLIICVMLICVSDPQGEIPRDARPDYNPFSSPLATLGAIDVYGLNPLHPVHWQGLNTMVEQHGGFENLKLYGSRFLLSYAAVKYSMHTLTRPIYPPVDHDGNDLRDKSALDVLQVPRSNIHWDSGVGFKFLARYGILPSVMQVLAELGELAQGINLLLPRMEVKEVSDHIFEARNLNVYRLLSLPRPTESDVSKIFGPQVVQGESSSTTTSSSSTSDPATPPSSSSSSSPSPALAIYSACWTAAFLFTSQVAMPLPRSRPIRLMGVPQLDAASRGCDAIAAVNPDPLIRQFQLYCAVLGGIAAEDIDPETRQSHVLRVRQLCEILNLRSWQQVVSVMRMFAWMDVAMDHGGRKLWNEVIEGLRTS